MPIVECELPDGGGKGYRLGSHGKCYADRADAEKQAAAEHSNGFVGDVKLALDKATVRTIDPDNGWLRVAVTNISRACVNPYIGREIPKHEELGLDASTVYYLLRDPEELKKAAPTFGNVPLLDKHIPVSADEPQQDNIVGATGSDAEYVHPFLRNSLNVWAESAIEAIQSGEMKDLSAAYFFDADMTPGEYEGERYDGVMRNLRANHVALVDQGRTGPEVVVSDSQPEELRAMAAKITTLPPRVATAFEKANALRGRLAQDADFGDLVALLDVLDESGAPGEASPIEGGGEVDNDDATEVDDGGEDLKRILAQLQGVLSDEDLATLTAAVTPEPEPAPAAVDAEPPGSLTEEDDKDDRKPPAALEAVGDEFEPKKKDAEKGPVPVPGVTKAAMDAAIQSAANAAEARTIRRMNAIHAALEEVRPIVGRIATAQTSPDEVYKIALDSMPDIDLNGVPASAYGALFRSVAKARTAAAKPAPKAAKPAMDGANVADFNARFPAASRLRVL